MNKFIKTDNETYFSIDSIEIVRVKRISEKNYGIFAYLKRNNNSYILIKCGFDCIVDAESHLDLLMKNYI